MQVTWKVWQHRDCDEPCAVAPDSLPASVNATLTQAHPSARYPMLLLRGPANHWAGHGSNCMPNGHCRWCLSGLICSKNLLDFPCKMTAPEIARMLGRWAALSANYSQRIWNTDPEAICNTMATNPSELDVIMCAIGGIGAGCFQDNLKIHSSGSATLDSALCRAGAQDLLGPAAVFAGIHEHQARNHLKVRQ